MATSGEGACWACLGVDADIAQLLSGTHARWESSQLLVGVSFRDKKALIEDLASRMLGVLKHTCSTVADGAQSGVGCQRMVVSRSLG